MILKRKLLRFFVKFLNKLSTSSYKDQSLENLSVDIGPQRVNDWKIGGENRGGAVVKCSVSKD